MPGLVGADDEDPLGFLRRNALALLETIRRTVGVAKVLVGQDRTVDLSGFDRDVGLLCAKALDLPPEEGWTLRPLLLELREEVDCLMAAIRSQKNQ